MTDRAALASDAFIYGFPLVFDLQEVGHFTAHGMGSIPPTPFNRFGHATTLAGPDDAFVSINNDTIYSAAQVDVGGGPVRLEVPDTAGRYYVLQFVDAWTNNFAYVGHRATGTGAGTFLLVDAGWEGDDQGATVIRCPTRVVSIVGRWAVSGEDDLPAVRALQDGLTLHETAPGPGLPAPDPAVGEPLAFFERLRVWMQAFPPAPRDRAVQERFAPLGLLTPGDASPYSDPDPDLAADLRAGLAAGRERLEAAIKHPGAQQNGWHVAFHVFDYNLDYFEVGALDGPEWKLPDTPARYLTRAVAARAGLWGNHAYEAAYTMVYDDGDGAPLDGSKRYALRFASPPPCDAFWSVTMYDAQDFYLVANPIDRYSIGDRTPGLRRDADGSLTLVLQHDAPEDPDERANWLPTPQGAFRPMLRMYEPEAAVLDGAYELPPIVARGG